MVDEQKFGARPNFEWPPKRYYNYAAYVMLFNGIVNDHENYGLENSNGDQVILAYIKQHVEELSKKPEFEFIYYPDNHPEDFTYAMDGDKETGLGNKAKFKTKELADAAKKEALERYKKELKDFIVDIDNYHAQAKTDSATLNGYVDGGYLKGFVSNEQMAEIILPAKRKSVRGWHEAVRLNSKGKSGDYNMDKGKEANGEHYRAFVAAEQKRKDYNTQVRRNGAKTFLRGAVTLAFAGVTAASVGALLYFGGFALTSIFGTAVKGVGGAILGVGGTVVGGACTKGFFGRFFDSWKKGKALRKQRREFMQSYGAGADKDGKAQGYKNIKQRYAEDLFLKYALENVDTKRMDKARALGKEAEEREARKELERLVKKFSADNPDLAKNIKKAFSRGDFPLNAKEIAKEAGYYKFVTDKYKPSERNYGFEYMISKLGNAKSMNLNDSHSVQAHTLITESALKENSKLGLLDLKDKLEELVRAKPKFEKDADNMDKYNDLMYAFSDRLETALDSELFEKAYTSNLVGNTKAIYDRPEVTERFKATRSGDNTDFPENAFKFINDLRTDNANGGVLNDSVGASVESQVVMTKEMMEKACDSYGSAGIPKEIPDPANPETKIANPEYETMQRAIAAIADIRHNGDTSTEEANALIASMKRSKVRDYLSWMRDKKLNESTMNSNAIENRAAASRFIIDPTLAADIASITSRTSPERIEQIKSSIMSRNFEAYPATSPATILADKNLTDARSVALSMVQSQIDALARNKRNRLAESALECIRGDKLHEYKELMEKLPKDDVEEINPDQLAITLKTYQKVLPAEMSEYLICKLKDKVTSILKRKATGSKFDTTGGNFAQTIENLQKYITNLGNCVKCGIIDEYQKNICSKVIEEKIVSAFGPYLDNLEKEFLKDVDKTRALAEGYLKEMKLGGFAEFLNSNTVQATALKNRIQRIYDATNLSDLMTADSRGAAFGKLVCADANETKIALRVYFLRDRNDGDVLYNVLKKMQEITRKTGGFSTADDPELISAMGDNESRIIGTGNANTSDYENKSYVYMMKELVDKLDTDKLTFDNKPMPAEDMLASLLVMKKRTLAMVKAQMNQLYNVNAAPGESISSFVNNNRHYFGRIKDKWDELAGLIDEKANKLQNKVKTEYMRYSDCKSCIEDGIGYGNYANYLASKEMSV